MAAIHSKHRGNLDHVSLTTVPPHKKYFPRLINGLFREIRGITKPELLLALLFALAGLVYKQFIDGGLSRSELFSLFIPALWVVFVVICIYTIKSAWAIRREDVSEWTAWQPALYGSIRPEKPTLGPVLVPTTSLTLLWAVIAVAITAVVDRYSRVLLLSSLLLPRLEVALAPTLQLRSKPDRVMASDVTEDFQSVHLKFIGFAPSQFRNAGRELQIQSAMEEYYKYLKRIGFEPPTLVPMIGIVEGERGTVGGVYGVGSSAYALHMGVPINSIANGEGSRQAYGQYAFNVLLGYRTEGGGPEWPNRFELAWLLPEYYNASFTGKIPSTDNKWLATLFEIRKNCGKESMDTTLFILSKLIDEPFYRIKEKQDFTSWFRARLHNSFMQANTSDKNISKFVAIMQRWDLPRAN